MTLLALERILLRKASTIGRFKLDGCHELRVGAKLASKGLVESSEDGSEIWATSKGLDLAIELQLIKE